jgi:uncharacterized protein YuzE
MHGGNFRCSLIIDKNMGSIEFDSKVNAMYIRLKKGKVDKSEPLADNVIMDVDKKGKAIGIEILLPEKEARVKELVSRAIITDHREGKKRFLVLHGCIDKDRAEKDIEELKSLDRKRFAALSESSLKKNG